jgi:hypothetical protein
VHPGRAHSLSTIIKACPGTAAGCDGGSALSGRCRYKAGSGYPPERETDSSCALETDTCKEGHGGPYCSTCIDGWFAVAGGECQRCGAPADAMQGMLVLLAVLAALVVLVLVYLGARRQLVLLRAFGPSGTDEDIALALRPLLEPALKMAKGKDGPLKWEDALPLIKQRVTMETLMEAMQHPRQFAKELKSSASPLGRRLLLARLKPKVEPRLKQFELSWEDVMPAIEMVDSFEKLKAALENADEFMMGLVSAAAPMVRTRIVKRVRPNLEPLLERRGLPWEAAVPMLQQIASLDALREAISDPEAFVRDLADAGGPAARAFLLAKLRPELEPIFQRRGLAWADALSVIELVDSVEELRAAVDDPEAFLAQLVDAGGPAAIRFLLGQLRPRLEPLLHGRGLAWEDMPFDMIDEIDEIKAAAEDLDAFMKRLAEAGGPVAR